MTLILILSAFVDTIHLHMFVMDIYGGGGFRGSSVLVVTVYCI